MQLLQCLRPVQRVPEMLYSHQSIEGITVVNESEFGLEIEGQLRLVLFLLLLLGAPTHGRLLLGPWLLLNFDAGLVG